MSGLNRPPLDPDWYCNIDDNNISLEEITSVEQLENLNNREEIGGDGDDDVYLEKDAEAEDEDGDTILDKTIEFDLGPTGLRIGVHFPNKKTAEKSLRKWCDENFCPLAKVILQLSWIIHY